MEKTIDGLTAHDIYHMDGCPVKLCHSKSMTSARIDWEHTTTPKLFEWYKKNRLKLILRRSLIAVSEISKLK